MAALAKRETQAVLFFAASAFQSGPEHSHMHFYLEQQVGLAYNMGDGLRLMFNLWGAGRRAELYQILMDSSKPFVQGCSVYNCPVRSSLSPCEHESPTPPTVRL